MAAARITNLQLGDNQHKSKGVEISTPSLDLPADSARSAGAAAAPITAAQAANLMKQRQKKS